MIALLSNFQVPGLSYITIYPDHQDPFLFYYFKTRPKLATDSETGDPMLSYMMVARNADLAVHTAGGDETAAEVQLGYLNMTVDLGLTQSEEDKIITYLQEMVSGSNYEATVKLFFKDALPLLTGTADKKKKVRISSVSNCLNGTTRMWLMEGLGDTFKRSSVGEVSPALNGNFSASFYATFGAEGADLMYKALSGGYSTDGKAVTAPTEAIISYSLKVPAYVPPLKAHVHVDVSSIYDNFKEITNNQTLLDTYTSSTIDLGEGTAGFKRVTTSGRVLLSKQDIDNVLRKIKTDNKSITIKIEDNAGFATDGNDSITTKLLDAMIQMVSNNIIPSIFNVEVADVELTPEDQKAAGTPDIPLNENYSIKQTLYHLKEEEYISNKQDIDFDLEKSTTMMISLEANGLVISSIPIDKLKALVKIVDITDPSFQMMSIPVSVNADFEKDEIVEIDVDVNYAQQDAETGIVRKNHKMFRFKNISENYNFRATMAKDKDGKFLDNYEYKSRVIYLGREPGGDNDGWTPVKTTNEKGIVISYAKLGYLKVQVQAADIDWTVVKEAVVSLEYLGASGKSDTKTDIRLTQNSPIGNWTCYKYGSESNEYSYKVRYINIDGSEIESKKVKETKEALAINDLLVNRISASFDVVMSSAVAEKVKLQIKYEDNVLGIHENYYHWFDQTDSWDWNMRQREGATDQFRYCYMIVYAGGNTEVTPWSDPVKPGDEIPPLTLNKALTMKTTLQINAMALNWTKWQFAYVYVKYEDPEHGIDFEADPILLSAETGKTAKVETTAYANAVKPFICWAQLVNAEGEVLDIPATEKKGVFIVTEPKAEEPKA